VGLAGTDPCRATAAEVRRAADPRLSLGDNVNGVLVFRAQRAERLAFTLTAQSDVGPDNPARGDMVVFDAAKGVTRYLEVGG
jgi:hypothetical protein